MTQHNLSRSVAIIMFCAFALGYLMSSMMRGVTATLSPTLTKEFGLSAGNLGLLAGAYFLGFAAMQIPLGRWLDRYGPRKVLASLLCVALVSCIAFSLAESFAYLLVARLLGGIGVCACLMAALTAYRRWYPTDMQQRSNAWMLMVGAFGLLISTLPVQWLLPIIGWRYVFVIMAGLFALSIIGVWFYVPAWTQRSDAPQESLLQGLKTVFSDHYFLRLAPLGFVNYGVVIAVQTLWAGPWMVNVAGATPMEAAQGLFGINLVMLVVFWLWGLITPTLERRGIESERLLLYVTPLSIVSLLAIAVLGPQASWIAFAVFCATASVLALAQPAVGMVTPQARAGKALATFNLVLFAGAFVFQWCIGLSIDLFKRLGFTVVHAYQWSFVILAFASLAAYCFFAFYRRDLTVRVLRAQQS